MTARAVSGPAVAALLAVLLTACGAHGSALADGSSSAVRSPDTGAEAVSHGGPVLDHVSFVDRLRAGAMQVQIAGSVEQVGLRPPGTRLRLLGSGLASPAELTSFNYDATDLGGDARVAAAADAAGIAADGTLPAGGILRGPARWYHAERLLVRYAGSDRAVDFLLRGILGRPFAGG